MAARGDLGVFDGDRGRPEKRPVSGAASAGVTRARAVMGRYLASNTTRSQLPSPIVRQLDEIRGNGNRLFATLEPYQRSSVFLVQLSEEIAESLPKSAKDEREEKERKAFAAVPEHARNQLQKTAKEFMAPRFEKFPAEERDMETTCAVSAFFFLAGAARYVPDVIFESSADASAKQREAELFVAFFNQRLSDFFLPERRWKNAREMHGLCYAAYLDFKREMPDLFSRLLKKLISGELMGPYGTDKFSVGWPYYHYKGLL
ncbi:MAG: hypothetical protein AB1529_06945 [Candidatus Micrarchaeota archaeon]